MHEGQSDIGVEAVERLVFRQFPAWRGLPVTAVVSHGTVNTLFRLGDNIVLRFLLFPNNDPAWRGELLAAQKAVARLAARVAVQLPVPLAVGEPEDDFPGFWAVYEWIPGMTVRETSINDLDTFAVDLAAFIRALQEMPTDGRTWNGLTRGGPLVERDVQVRKCIADSAALVDARHVEAVWDDCLAAPYERQGDVWIHADLMPGNLLVRDGRLAAVIDCEGLCVGDLSVDLMPAWNFLPAGPRDTFRRELAVDEAAWTRGRGWALSQAIVALPYYVETNEVMAETALHTLVALLD
ncbi:MAG TPA: aminoglycoside phosphotransferase family protein [Acidimicrobiales bacterium]|nr:aminoglycoside phosphotransferase family protein [Acidimicrobiales bacterium]